MNPMLAQVSFVAAQVAPTFAVATIYCLWHRVRMHHEQRLRRLRQRVAYMLWAAAEMA
jgi:uncharacterized paraquat-inducible protein A